MSEGMVVRDEVRSRPREYLDYLNLRDGSEAKLNCLKRLEIGSERR